MSNMATLPSISRSHPNSPRDDEETHAHADNAANSDGHPQSDDPYSAIKLEHYQHDSDMRPHTTTSDSPFDNMVSTDLDVKPPEPKLEPTNGAVKFEEEEGEDEKPTMASTPTGSKSATPAPKAGPQLIGNLPRAEDDALRTFEQIGDNWYQYNTLGRSPTVEVRSMRSCGCVPAGRNLRSEA